ncbi:MAG: hypothetical protein ABII12_13160 [Planctomycetota bacterium]
MAGWLPEPQRYWLAASHLKRPVPTLCGSRTAFLDPVDHSHLIFRDDAKPDRQLAGLTVAKNRHGRRSTAAASGTLPDSPNAGTADGL